LDGFSLGSANAIFNLECDLDNLGCHVSSDFALWRIIERVLDSLDRIDCLDRLDVIVYPFS
jgi:hypothetical protein